MPETITYKCTTGTLTTDTAMTRSLLSTSGFFLILSFCNKTPSIQFEDRKTMRFLANVHVRYMLSSVRPSVCRLLRSCALLRRFKFSAIFLRHLVPWPSIDIHRKFHGDRPRKPPPSGELNTRGVVKYSDFGPIDGYISETVQDRM